MPSLKTIRQAQCWGERARQVQRCVVLTWDAEPAGVKAREGVSRIGLNLDLGLAKDQHTQRFMVLRSDLAAAPTIGTIFSIEDRTERWRLVEVTTGTAESDVFWTFECVQEY